MDSIIHLFSAGGFVMVPLFIFLIATWMIGVERVLLYRRFRRNLNAFTKSMDNQPSWVMLPTVVERDAKELGELLATPMRRA